MSRSDNRVEVFGLEGLRVTDRAREVIEHAGYEVSVRILTRADLPSLRFSLGASHLPAAVTGAEVLQGMSEIRAYFEKGDLG